MRFVAKGLLAIVLSTSLFSSSAWADVATMVYDDGPDTLSSAYTVLLNAGSGIPQATVFAKVVIGNTSGGSRSVQCRLQYSGISADYARVTLAAGASATISMQAANETNTVSIPTLECRVTSASTSGVQAEWAKVTEIYHENVEVEAN